MMVEVCGGVPIPVGIGVSGLCRRMGRGVVEYAKLCLCWGADWGRS